jgi:hypothetical protein
MLSDLTDPHVMRLAWQQKKNASAR